MMTTESVTEQEAGIVPEPEMSERDRILQALEAHDRGLDAVPESEQEPMPEKLATGESQDKEQAGDQARSKEDKEAERFDRNWKKFQEEKDAFKREQEELNAFREKTLAEIRKARFESSTRPEDYEKAAERFEEEGQDDLAAEARRKANAARDEFAREKAEYDRYKAEQQWQRNYGELVKAEPDLADESSELNKLVRAAMKERPILQTYPDGIKDAVHIAKLAINSNRYESALEEKARLEQQIKDLQAKLNPGGETVSPRKEARSVENMKPAEAREYFRKAFAEYDN